MAWEIAIVLSILGTSFFLVYFADKIQPDSVFHDALKTIIFLVSLAMLLINASVPMHLVQNLNATNSTEITQTGIQTLTNVSSLNFRILTYTLLTVMFLMFVWMIFVLFSKMGKFRVGKE